jgi:hypothetical protein
MSNGKQYWFVVKAEFICPNCKTLSEEVLYLTASKPDPRPISAAIQTQDMKCQWCKTTPTDRTELTLNVQLVTLAEANATGLTSRSKSGL